MLKPEISNCLSESAYPGTMIRAFFFRANKAMKIFFTGNNFSPILSSIIVKGFAVRTEGNGFDRYGDHRIILEERSICY